MTPAFCSICCENQPKCLIGKVSIHGSKIKIAFCVDCIDKLAAKSHNEPRTIIKIEGDTHEIEKEEAWSTATWDSD